MTVGNKRPLLGMQSSSALKERTINKRKSHTWKTCFSRQPRTHGNASLVDKDQAIKTFIAHERTVIKYTFIKDASISIWMPKYILEKLINSEPSFIKKIKYLFYQATKNLAFLPFFTYLTQMFSVSREHFSQSSSLLQQLSHRTW